MNTTQYPRSILKDLIENFLTRDFACKLESWELSPTSYPGRFASIFAEWEAKCPGYEATSFPGLGNEVGYEVGMGPSGHVDLTVIYIEDITRRREDMTFYLRVVKTLFYERAQRVSKILFLTREDKSHISSNRVMFCLLYSPKQKIV